jgi:hypothetical protein
LPTLQIIISILFLSIVTVIDVCRVVRVAYPFIYLVQLRFITLFRMLSHI